MRKSTLHPQLEELKVTDEQAARFDSWLAGELADAQAAQGAWQALGVQERGRIVSEAVDRFVAAKDEIARAIRTPARRAG